MPKSYFSRVLHLVRANSPYTVIILAIFTLLLKLQALAHAVMPVADVHHVCFGAVVNLFAYLTGRSAVAFTVFAIIITFAQGLYLMSIVSRHRLFTRHTYLPAFAYIVLSSLHPGLGQFTVQLLQNWLLLGALDAVLHFARREEPNRVVFNAGFLLGCTALLHFPALLYCLLFMLALLWLRSFRIGEWVVGLLGYMTPFYFAIAFLYLFDGLGFIKSWPHWGLGLPQKAQVNIYLVGLIAGCVLLLVSGTFSLTRIFYRMPVSVRRGWGAIGTALLVSVGVAALSPRTEATTWLGVLPALSLLVIPPMFDEKRAHAGRRQSVRFATFTFYLLLALVVFCQLALHY